MGFTVTFIQQKDVLGRTAILAHLAHSWAQKGRSVGLVELDKKQPLAKWANKAKNLHMTLKQSRDWRVLPDIRESAKHHDLTLVDCPNVIDAGLHAAVRASDLLVIPCQPTGMDAWSAKAILVACKAEKTPARVLINSVPKHADKIEKIVGDLQKSGAEVLSTRLDNKVTFSLDMLDATPSANGQRPRDEIESLRREIEHILISL